MQLHGLDLFFWAFGFAGHCVLLGVLWLRHRATHFPFFTALIAGNVVRTIILYFTYRYGSVDSYFYTYWVLAFLDLALMVAVLYELSSCIFRPLGPWAPQVKRNLAIFAGASLAVASLLTWLATPPTRMLRSAVVIRGNFFTSAVMSELFVVMLVLSVTMGFPWRTHVARITQGFGVYAIFCVLADSAHSYFGTDRSDGTYTLVSQIRISLYCLCVVYWIVELARNEPEPRKLPEELRLELHALQSRVATVLQGFREVGRA